MEPLKIVDGDADASRSCPYRNENYECEPK